jgi:hypothetical protein
MGYHFEVQGSDIVAEWQGPSDPDPHQVKPMLEAVKAHKDEVILFLKCYCPRCGGCCFMPDYEEQPLCAACDWNILVELYPGLKLKQGHGRKELKNIA